MTRPVLPPADEMLEAFLARDPSYEGIFYTAVRTTGVFCRPTCGARKPAPENVDFYPSAADALADGYRPCRRCRPMAPPGAAPAWVAGLVEAVEEDPARRWTDADLRAMDLEPERVRRWFKRVHGMTFHAYHRARRLGLALSRLRDGDDPLAAAYEHGYDSASGFYDAFRKVVGTTPGRADEATPIVLGRIATPLGPMVAGATEDGLRLLEFADRRSLESEIARVHEETGGVAVPGANPVIERLEEELAAYFAGELRAFEVPLAPTGTAFQRRVWDALRAIPYGETRSYLEQARAIGATDAVRAVARANGENRIAIVVPCHRVIGSDGSLTGYGGGLWRKRRLLDLERSVVEGSPFGPLFRDADTREAATDRRR